MDAFYYKVSVATTFKDKLTEKGIIFHSYLKQFKNIPISKKISWYSYTNHGSFFATLNSAVFTMAHLFIFAKYWCQWNFLRILELMHRTGQFGEIIIADKGSYVSYLEGCTAPTGMKTNTYCKC